jgi:choline-sulfatase
MRILYIDIDSLRPDHLGCYGYHRDTSPNIDAVARDAVRFTNLYVTDAPCLPSRTALWSGRFGFHTGLVNHGGTAGQPFIQGVSRQMQDEFGQTGWIAALRNAGFKTTTISTFGERHSAWHWYAGFNEIYNIGRMGQERADEITPVVLDWLGRHGREDNWFLHVNLWDAHTPYRTPADFPNPFARTPLPAHYTPEYWQCAWESYGPHSPQEANGFRAIDDFVRTHYPQVPHTIASFEDVRWWIDGYDIGIRYADYFIGHILNWLTDHGIYDDTIIMIGADHGENLGELNVWADHQTADAITCHVPLVVRFPGITPRVDDALHYHFDWAATLVELVGGQVAANWDGQPFTNAFRRAESAGRDYLVTSQGAWSVQRGVRFDEEGHSYMFLRTYHDGYKMLDDAMLFDLSDDPHEQVNLAASRPELVQHGIALLENWTQQMMKTSRYDVDPLMTVLREGGPHHTRGELPAYLQRLRETGRAAQADTLAAKHPAEAVPSVGVG